MLDDAYSGVLGGQSCCKMDAWKDVLIGRCFGDSVHHVHIRHVVIMWK